MIKMGVQIKVYDGGGSIITGIIDNNFYYNNISASLEDVLNIKKRTKNVFLLSPSVRTSTRLNGNYTYSNGVDYVIAHTTGYNNVFTVIGENLTSITIDFDVSHNCYPNQFTVKGLRLLEGKNQGSTNINDYEQIEEQIINVYTVTSSIIMNNTCDAITVDFTGSTYNKEPYVLTISGIYSDIYFYGDRRTLKSCEVSFGNKNDGNSIDYSCITYNDTITLYDFYGELNKYIVQDMLGKGDEVIVYIENTITHRIDKYTRRRISSIEYDRHTKLCTIQITSRLDTIQDENVTIDTRDRSIAQIYNKMRDLSDDFVSINSLSNELYDTLDNIIISDYNVPDNSIYSVFTDICTATATNLSPTNTGLMRLK